MTPFEITEMINREIGSDWGRSNAHGVVLRDCLVTPQLRAYGDPVDDTRTFNLWRVLEEDPETHAGYEIVFDEENRSFGLAITDEHGHGVFLGSYGTFIETLDGM